MKTFYFRVSKRITFRKRITCLEKDDLLSPSNQFLESNNFENRHFLNNFEKKRYLQLTIRYYSLI